MTLLCKVLTTEAEIQAIAGEWRQLHAQIGKTPFTDYDWFHVLWCTIGKDMAQQRCIFIGLHEGKLAAVLPLMITRRKGLRIMRSAGQSVFHYSDMLCETHEQAMALWRAAYEYEDYDFADIRDVYEESPCYSALESFARKRDDIGALSLQLHWPTGADWIASLPTQIRKPLKRRERRLAEKGPVHFEICRGEPIPFDTLDKMLKLKMDWAEEREKRGIYDYSNIREYFQQFLKIMAQKDALFLSCLKCGDEEIAYVLAIPYRGVLHGYVIAYDPAWAVYSPGIIVMVRTLCWAIDNGFLVFDHRHGTNRYKSRYSNNARKCSEFTFSNSLRGRVAECAFIATRRVWRLIKRNPPDIVDNDIKNKVNLAP